MTTRWALAVLVVLGSLLSACTSPSVMCPAVPWTAEFQFYETALTAPGTAELVAYTPDTVGPCGPGFSVERVRFYADGAPLGEGVPYGWWSSGAPERLRYLWQLVPGEDGVPEAGSANISLSAELVVRDDEAKLQTIEVYGTPQLEVIVRDAPTATSAQRLEGTVQNWPGGERSVEVTMNQGFDFEVLIATGDVGAQGELDVELPLTLNEEWYGYLRYFPITECPQGEVLTALDGIFDIRVNETGKPPEETRQLGFLGEGSSAEAVEDLLQAEVGNFVVVRAFASKAFSYRADCSWEGFEGRRHVVRYDVEVVQGWNAFTVRLEQSDAAVKGWRITSATHPPRDARWFLRPHWSTDPS